MQSNPGRLLFTQSDVPSSSRLWQEFKSRCELGDLAAETCQNAAMRYVAVATNDKSAWKGALQRGMAKAAKKPFVLPGRN